MVQSAAVENYLKGIYHAQAALTCSTDLVSMGQLASSLGVVPGTATTMVKALAEAGLVHYEPYAGVRLTPAGEKLAALVLRRHRLDPHGDPIPSPEGTLVPQHHGSLLACPLRTPLIVTRVTDQDTAFLHFIEQHDLKPGEVVEVESRDPAADSVRLRSRDDRRITIGARAASKLLVRVTVTPLSDGAPRTVERLSPRGGVA